MLITPLTPTIGAEISGIDLADERFGDPSNEAVMAQLMEAFITHHVLVIRGQRLDTEQQKALGRRFGSLHVHPSKRQGTDGDPEIFTVRADESTRLNNGGLWHTDVSCDETPPLGSLLLLTEAPPVGGDTLFADMHRAYDTLSPPIRRMLAGLTAVHDQRQDLVNYGFEPRPGVTYPRAEHPVVVAHPETGRPLLFVNRAFTTHIVGLSRPESDAVLRLLFDHIAGRPDVQCRVRWESDTLVFWDNRCVQHFAVWDYRPAVRQGARVTIAADAPPAPAFPDAVASVSTEG